MKHFYPLLGLLLVTTGYAQTSKKTFISGIIITPDSVPVSNVAVINTRTSKTVRTNSLGYFQSEIESNDSLLVHHIAYKRLFINEKNNGKYIVVEPEIHELKQVDIKQDEYKVLNNNLANIRELARKNKPTKEELKSLSQKITDQHGSHSKGFSPFFGPTTQVAFGKIGQLITRRNEKLQRKQLTSHYHLVKKKPVKKHRIKIQKNS